MRVGRGEKRGGKREWKGKEGEIRGIGWEMDDGKEPGRGGGGEVRVRNGCGKV